MGGKAAAPAPAVSRETPAPTPAEEIMEPALRSGMTAQAPAPTPDKLAALGPGYQAALALSFLADTDDKEDRDIDREPGVAEKWLAESTQAPRSTALAGFSDISIKSPFAEPRQPTQMFNEGGEVEEPGLLSVPTYSRTVSYEMYPAQEGQFDQRDAARHMLASGTLARKYGPTAAEMLGKLHEIGTSPLRFIGSKLGISEMPVDYEQDLHNNRLGIELGKRSKSQKDLEDLVQQLAEQAKGQRMEGKPWTGRPVKRSDGGDAAPTEEEIAAASRPATVNPNIQRQGEAARRLAAMRDVNTLPDPRTYAAASGFLGTAPDEMGFSALHPDREGIKKAGEAGFGVGTALQVAPIVGGAMKLANIGPSSGGKATAASQLGAMKLPGRTPESIFSPTPSADAPFVGRLDEMVANLQGPVQKDQFLGMLKGKMRDYDIARAEQTLADLPGNAKLSPVDLLNRIKTQYDPALIRTTVRDPREAGSGVDFWNHVDNPYRGQPVGVIHMSTFVSPEQTGRIKSLDQLDSKLFLASQVGYNSEAKIPGLDALRTDAIANTQIARLEEARQNLIEHSAPLFEAKRIMNEYEYPGTSPAYNSKAIEAGLATAKQNRVPQAELTNYVHNLILENIRQPAIAKMQQLLGTVPTNDFELRAAVRAKQGPLWDDQRRVLETELAGMVPDIRRYFGANASKFGMESSYKGKDIHLSLEPPENAAGFSRFVEQTVQDPDRGPLKGIHLLEIQSDMTSELKEGRKAGLSNKQVFSDMPGNRRLVQQLGMKNAISAAINRGDQFVTFPGKESAKPQLYESVRDNLKAVAKDLGPGFEIRPFTFTNQQGTAIQHYGITWGPEAASRTQQKGVPFKDGGAVERR
jgi:hypothetical protein